MMDCAHARAVLWPPDRPKLAHADVIAARAHVTDCASCRAHFEIDRLLEDARRGLLGEAAPKVIRERVFRAVAHKRSGRGTQRATRRKRRGVAAMLGGLAVAGVILVSQLAAPGSADGQLGAAFVDDYMRLAVREDHIVTSDSAEVRRFLMRELGTMVAPLSAPGFIIEGAEVCLLRGRRGAMIRYRTDAGPVSYYMVPGASVRGRLPTINTTSSNGTTLVTWVSGHTERALVGPLPAADLLAIARHETE